MEATQPHRPLSGGVLHDRPADRLWAQLSLNSTRSYINANSDYDAGDTTDFEYASSDIYINANYDNDNDDHADCHDASSDNYNI